MNSLIEKAPDYSGISTKLQSNSLNEQAALEEKINQTFLLAVDHHQHMRLKEAEYLYRRILEIRPNLVECLNNLITLLITKEEGTDLNELGRMCLHALSLEPNNAKLHDKFAAALTLNGQPEEAEKEYKKAIELDPNDMNIRSNYSKLLGEILKSEEAIKQIDIALKKEVTPKFIMNKGVALIALGRLEEAEECFRKAIGLEQSNAEAWRNITSILKYKTSDNKDASEIRKLLETGKLSPQQKACLYFSLGKIHDDSKEYDQAFENYKKGNELIFDNAQKGNKFFYDRKSHDAFCKGVIKGFDKKFWQEFKKSGYKGNDSRMPIFVVGMPRSGTTLTEKIIAQHPQASGAGELTEMRNTIKLMTPALNKFAQTGQPFSEEERHYFDRLAEKYLARLGRDAEDGVVRVVDKLPGNFLHLGHIAILFPNAKIIHCNRNPLDTCLSNFFQYFASGIGFSFNLEAMAHYYGHYKRLMEHYNQSGLPLEILDVHYEELTSDTDTGVKKILDFIGLDFDENCLKPHESSSGAHTASAWQIKQPIYKTSQERWKRYESQLQPLMSALEKEGVL